MNETNVDSSRDLLHLVSKHSNIATPDLEAAFETEEVYAGPKQWDKILYFSLPGMGISFFVAGVIFFFAFNWILIPAFAKFSIIGGLLIASVLISYRIKATYEHISHILMALAFVLVGVLFAVFGQVYQTGADAYDLFIVWTLSVLAWTIISPYPVIWFLFAVLSNLTLLLYFRQTSEAMNPGGSSIFTVVLNILLGLGFYFKKTYAHFNSTWLFYTLTIYTAYMLTKTVCMGLFDHWPGSYNWTLFLLALLYFPLNIWYGNRKRDVFYIAITALCLLVIANALLIKFLSNILEIDGFSGILLLFAILNVGATIIIVKLIISLRKKWQHETITSTTDTPINE